MDDSESDGKFIDRREISAETKEVYKEAGIKTGIAVLEILTKQLELWGK